MSCAQCRRLIRSNIFYECVCEGTCHSGVFYEYSEGENSSKSAWRPCQCESSSGSLPSLRLRSHFRLCAPCKNVTDSCNNGRVLGLAQYEDPWVDGVDVGRLRIELHKLDVIERQKEEKLKSGKDVPKMPQKDRVALKVLEWTTPRDGLAAQSALRTCALMLKGNLAPAGNFHLCLMLGPLIFESGQPETYRGILVSPRLPPHLFPRRLGRPNQVECPYFYQARGSKRVEYKTKPMPIRQRPILGCVKRVYGGAFSGYPNSTRRRQNRVIELFVAEAVEYAAIASSKAVEAKWKRLGEAADKITTALKDYIGKEVDKHLNRVSRILLDERTIRGWNPYNNSCQWLVMRLLAGQDFETVIPRFPASLDLSDEKKEEASFAWPRYLISFGPNIDGFNQSFYQPQSMITNFAQSRPSIDYDLIEYFAWLRCKTASSPPGATQDTRLQLSRLLREDITTDSLWAMPGDTLSMLQLHLLRQPSKYGLSEADWTANRFLLLHLLDMFAAMSGALGSSVFHLLSQDRQLLSRVTIPSARVLGNVLASEKVRMIRLSSRWVAYDIENRIPSAMGVDKELRRQLQKEGGAPGDPVHGEEVLSTMVEFFLTPLALVAGRTVTQNLGQIFRFHHNGPWITLNLFGHTYVCPLFLKQLKSVRG
ncbi:uncharacterized protein B0H64DRAFT_436149 [Chaetomium fimeti]|uniref:Uncharacterized protein n=1 Tax=Chaetomium fimeti TaxID=1854472 RepID=A0AAE0H7M1_9PEZI|nr:hypothetical protein B0H64DRAFT_436149 [Chaetomium fimeti]